MLPLTKKSTWLLLAFSAVTFLGACSSGSAVVTPAPAEVITTPQPTEDETTTFPASTVTKVIPLTETLVAVETSTPHAIPTEEMGDQILADVLSVAANGSENAYTFAVEIRSPDTGCEQYADWWEVVTEDGTLIYRRILAHSHVGEQPFTRSGGPAAISADTVVIVRAHMYPTGYGGGAFQGSVNSGFEEIQLEADFAPELEKVDPLPDGCAF